MSTNLTRRSLFAQTAAVAVVAAAPAALAKPEWQQPAVVETPAPIDPTKIEQLIALVALGKQLKPLFVEWFELRPKVSRAYDESSEAAGFTELGMNRTDEQQEEAMRRFYEARKRTGYNPLYKQMNALGTKIDRIARAILRIKTTNRLGDGIRAAAAIALGDEFHLFKELGADPEAMKLLWEMAADAGFPMPPWIEKKQKRARALKAAMARAQS